MPKLPGGQNEKIILPMAAMREKRPRKSGMRLDAWDSAMLVVGFAEITTISAGISTNRQMLEQQHLGIFLLRPSLDEGGPSSSPRTPRLKVSTVGQFLGRSWIPH